MDQTQQGMGLLGWCGNPWLMQRSHRHNDLELNFVERGWIAYRFGGLRFSLQQGQLALFWAVMPHQLVEVAPDTRMFWVTLPVSWFLQTQLNDALKQNALRGDHIAGDAQPSDAHLFSQWCADLSDGRTECRNIMLLEVEARLRRMGLQTLGAGDDPRRASSRQRAAPTNASRKSEAMAQYIALKFAEPLKLQDVAQAVGLHPNYASSLFRRTFGVGVVDYLTQHRVAHAQQLLVTTDLTVLEIAMHAGFGSSSQFYAAFTGLCGTSPRSYRVSLRHNK